MTRQFTRRSALRAGMLAGAGLAAAAAGCASGAQPSTGTTTGAQAAMSTNPQPKVLQVYFSRAGENYWNGGRRTLATGNTEVLTRMITDRIGCDVYRIEAADPYPASYDQTVARNVAEEQADARPAIAHPLPDIGRYHTVLLGSPVWNVQTPMIMSTFIEAVELTGKTVLPFVTYAVSGIGCVEDDYRTALPGATVGTGLAVRGETVADAGPDLNRWLRATQLLR